MDAQRVAVAQQCLNGAYDKTLSFPGIIGMLIAAGFEGYTVDYRRNTTTYYLADGDSMILDNRPSDTSVAPQFDPRAVAEQIRWAQANPPEYSYADFCKNVKTLGCAGLHGLIPGRRVLYFGRTAETHVEHFPQ